MISLVSVVLGCSHCSAHARNSKSSDQLGIAALYLSGAVLRIGINPAVHLWHGKFPFRSSCADNSGCNVHCLLQNKFV
jgi:hypothetical protein